MYRKIYYDGCNGWCLGGMVEVEEDEDGNLTLDEQEFGSRNGDGLLENESGDVLLVPC